MDTEDISLTLTFVIKPRGANDRGLKSHVLTQVILVAEVEEILLYLRTVRIIAVPLGVRLEAKGIRV